MARSSSPARISPSRRWLSGVSMSGTTISPISPRVPVTRTTRWPASATALAIVPPVPIVSSSGWAWTVIRVGRSVGAAWGLGVGHAADASAPRRGSAGPVPARIGHSAHRRAGRARRTVKPDIASPRRPPDAIVGRDAHDAGVIERWPPLVWRSAAGRTGDVGRRDGSPCRSARRVRRLRRGLHPLRPDPPRGRPADRHAQRERRVRSWSRSSSSGWTTAGAVEVDEVVVARDELCLVHADRPRGERGAAHADALPPTSRCRSDRTRSAAISTRCPAPTRS